MKWSLVLLLVLAACTARQPDQISVSLTVDGQTRAIVSDAKTVGDFLRQAGVALADLDYVRPPETSSLGDGDTVTVVRVVEKTDVITETIPFETQVIRDALAPPGTPYPSQPGRNGLRQIAIRIRYENGVEIRRERLGVTPVALPTPEIVRVGIKDAFSSVPFSGTLAFIGNNNAVVMRSTPANRRQVTAEGDLDGLVFDLSPDGRWLIYTRAVSGALNELWLADTALATPEVKSLNVAGVLWAGWSPDGKSIAYSTGEPSSGPAAWRARNDLFTLPIDAGRPGRARRVLEESSRATYAWWGSTFAWSPEATALAFADSDGVGVVDLTARIPEATRLVTFTAFNTRAAWAWVPAPSWSPDGQFIAFTLHGPSESGRDDADSERFDVYAVRRDGTSLLRLFNPAGMWAEPRWSPASAGPILALSVPDQPFDSDRSRYVLTLIDRDGSNRRRIFPEEGALGLRGRLDYDWSPDGSHIAIVRLTSSDVQQGDLYDLYLVDLAGGDVQRLTTDGTIRSPRWSR
jgi:Tol biopolymer transport system component